MYVTPKIFLASFPYPPRNPYSGGIPPPIILYKLVKVNIDTIYILLLLVKMRLIWPISGIEPGNVSCLIHFALDNDDYRVKLIQYNVENSCLKTLQIEEVGIF
jgi:hypothetical protein